MPPLPFIGRMLDSSIVFSFDASGFKRHAQDFEDPEIDVNLIGKICLVTGANSGLGHATSIDLARRGAQVVMLCRNPERGEKALREIREQSGSARVELRILDLSSLADIRRFAEEWDDTPIDALVHNAGVLPSERQITEDGLELCLATNLVGPFLLTALLWPALASAPSPRIVHVSSGGMYARRLDLQALEGTRGKYDGVLAYAHTKRAQVIVSEQLAARLKPQGIAVHCMHPGWADTPGVQSSIPGFWKATRGILRTPAQGADTITWLAAVDLDLTQSGLFWFDRAPRSTHLLPRTKENPEQRVLLWQTLLHWAGLDGSATDPWPPAPSDRASRED
jgi:dehydrogenase/reductase SDR family protein 12